MSSQPNPAVAAQPDAQQSPFHDPAEPILRAEPSIDDDSKANLWDTFHSKSADELVQHLHSLAIPNETKTKLWQAKQAMAPAPPAPGPVEKVASAIQKLSQMDPVTLDVAEKHPTLAKMFGDAAVKPPEAPKAAKEPQGASKSAGKGTAAQTKTPLVQPPRIDGLPHLPPIADDHYRVLASDSSLHDIPKENIEKARAIDPRMHILNP